MKLGAQVRLPNSKLDVTKILRLLREAIEILRVDPTVKADAWSYVYKAAARIDELYFKPSTNQ